MGDRDNIFLVYAFVLLVMAIIIIYLMYPTVRDMEDITKKIDDENDTNNKLRLRTQKIDIMTNVMYYGFGVIISLVLCVSFVLYYYGFRISCNH